MSDTATSYTNLPWLQSPMVDPKSGRLTPIWARFLIELWRRTGGGADTITPGGDTSDSTFTDINDMFGGDDVLPVQNLLELLMPDCVGSPRQQDLMDDPLRYINARDIRGGTLDPSVLPDVDLGGGSIGFDDSAPYDGDWFIFDDGEGGAICVVGLGSGSGGNSYFPGGW
jgi:hypothetical protein